MMGTWSILSSASKRDAERYADEVLARLERKFGRERRDYNTADFWASYSRTYR